MMNEDSTSIRGPVARRGLAAGFAVCAVATGTLLASHPSGGGGSFAERLKAEGANQVSDAFVHGGFIVTLCALMVCFAIWSRMLVRMLDWARVPVIVAMVTFCVGCGGLMASMVVDGFASPAIAARFAAAGDPDSLANAKVLLIFCGTLIRILMPLGLAMQAAAMLSWSWVLVNAAGWSRAVGVFGAVCAIASLILLLAFTDLSARLLPAVILMQVIWYCGLAALLVRRCASFPMSD